MSPNQLRIKYYWSSLLLYISYNSIIWQKTFPLLIKDLVGSTTWTNDPKNRWPSLISIDCCMISIPVSTCPPISLTISKAVTKLSKSGWPSYWRDEMVDCERDHEILSNWFYKFLTQVDLIISWSNKTYRGILWTGMIKNDPIYLSYLSHISNYYLKSQLHEDFWLVPKIEQIFQFLPPPSSCCWMSQSWSNIPYISSKMLQTI